MEDFGTALEKNASDLTELELVEDVWRGEAQDLLTQIALLQEENKSLLSNLSLKDSPMSEEDLQRQEGMSERERQVMKKLKEVVDKQRDEIRAKDRELTLKNEDVEALQQQQSRLMKINQDLRHRMTVVEAQGKGLIEQKVELEAAAQAQLQELSGLRQELAQLQQHQQGAPNLNGEEPPALAKLSEAAPATGTGSQSALMSDLTDPPQTLTEHVESEGRVSPFPQFLNWGSEEQEGGADNDEEVEEEAVFLWEALCDEDLAAERGALDPKDPNRPRFTLQELRDVLHERNELKAKVFMLQEELAYYRSEDPEEETGSSTSSPSPVPRARPHPNTQPESGIKRLFSFFSRDKRRGSQRNAQLDGSLGSWAGKDDVYTEQAQEALPHL
ncbi:RILP-like protein 1 isoform X3 [Conger conger]|uniref:RILP-like protein 1 isoform X3 n=1 Tax=Conger conger TaxID=82655 RepID=UPI002A5A8A0E|nr:RILP-like protein 1 isoform X3 [Conger conger]